MVIHLNLVKVLSLLLLEAILTIKNKFEGVELTRRLFSEGGGATTGTNLHHRDTRG